MLNDIHCLMAVTSAPELLMEGEGCAFYLPSSACFLSHGLSLRYWPESEKKVGWPPQRLLLMEADSGQGCPVTFRRQDIRRLFYALFVLCADFFLSSVLGSPTEIIFIFILFTKHLHSTHSVPDHILGAV